MSDLDQLKRGQAEQDKKDSAKVTEIHYTLGGLKSLIGNKYLCSNLHSIGETNKVTCEENSQR